MNFLHLIDFFHHFSCNKLPPKYSCPRCNLAYCSVACYKSPNHLKCSEEFYKQNVLQEMALQSKEKSASTSQNDDVKHMYEILKRIENDESIDLDDDFDESDGELDSDDENYEDCDADGEGSDLAKRLEGIDLNDADAIWSNLNEQERQDFKNIIQSEDVSAILPKFKAWWEKKSTVKLVTDITDDEMNGKPVNEVSVEHPPIIESIVDFNRISTKLPASCVVNNLFNVLGAYTSMVRFFYGDYETSKIEAVTYLMSICGNLRTNANFDDLPMAVEAIRQDGLNDGYLIDEEDVRQIKRDIDSIIEGPFENKPTNTYILAALSDLHGLMVATKNELKLNKSKPAEKPDATEEKATKSQEFSKRFNEQKADSSSLEKAKIVATIKKIEYYLAYANKFH